MPTPEPKNSSSTPSAFAIKKAREFVASTPYAYDGNHFTLLANWCDELTGKPYLGNATTAQLMDELASRLPPVAGFLDNVRRITPANQLAFRPVDQD